MTDQEILDSITAHYFYADGLTHTQMQEHRLLGSCPACRPPARATIDSMLASQWGQEEGGDG